MLYEVITDADPERLDQDDVGEGEGPGDHDHDQGCRGDDPPAALQPVRDRGRVVAGCLPGLAHPAEQEDLVVHRQAERQEEHQEGEPQRQRADRVACLDDEPEACALVDLVSWKERIGLYLQGGKVTYTDSAAPWNA